MGSNNANLNEYNTGMAEVNRSDILGPLNHLRLEQKKALQRSRYYLVSFPEALPRFLQSVRWNDLNRTVEARFLVRNWVKMDPLGAIELL